MADSIADKESNANSNAAANDACLYCETVDNEGMVQCDSCNLWAHLKCADLTAAMAKRNPWNCIGCKQKLDSASFQQQDFITPLNRKPSGVAGYVGATSVKGVSECKSGSVKCKRSLKIELEYLEKKKEAEMAFLKEKYELMRTYDIDESDSESDCKLNEVIETRTLNWANNQVSRGSGYEQLEQNKVEAVRQQSVAATNISSITQPRSIKPQYNESQNLNVQNDDADVVNVHRVNARRVVPRELPPFSGKPEEWPLFVSSFENSTRLCGFSNDENLLRLQRALKGKALESVGNKLLVPALVPEVISTLRMLFGRPELIINSSLMKIRAQPNVNPNKLETIISFALEIKNMTATMEATGLKEYLKNPMLVQELIEKLPAQMRMDWARHQRQVKSDNLATLSDWLYELAEEASQVTSVLFSSNLKVQRIGHHKEEVEDSSVTLHNKDNNNYNKNKTLACYYCGEKHFLFKCKSFKELSLADKWNKVKELKLCSMCMKRHEASKFCKYQKECGIDGCKKKHHWLLHKIDDNRNNLSETVVVATQHEKTSKVLYKIVPITVYGKTTSRDIYAFCDDGSGPTVIEKNLLQQLGLEGEKGDLCLRWTDGTTRIERDSESLCLKISARGKANKLILNNVRSVTALDLPSQSMDIAELASKHKHLHGLPVESYVNIIPQMIIGLNNHTVTTPLKYREGKPQEPAAAKTRLGWIVFGETNSSTHSLMRNFQLHICECNNDVALHKLVMENMKADETVDNKIMREESIAKNIVLGETYIARQGQQFIVKLLWKNKNCVMPDSYLMALQRLECFERKIQKDQNLKEFVDMHIQDMQTKGYVRKLNPNEVAREYPRKWYLPIFCVRNPNKPNKIRMVWDAAASCKGVSLNNYLDKGPDMLNSLVGVLYNFRIGKFGVCGDISEMFHRVLVDNNDQQAQRFLWRNGEKRAPDIYVLQVLSFGASCSPALAQSVKNCNAMEFKSQYPRAVKSIIERHYMDDMLDSMDTEEDVIKLAMDVREIHKHANFHIRNWLSNSSKITEALGETGEPKEFCSAGKRGEQVVEANKVLGMWWETTGDFFTFNLKFTKTNEAVMQGKKLPTKRELLRMLMSIFDPLGFLSFFLIDIKILFQQVWRTGIDWDDIIPEEFGGIWKKWLAELPEITNIKFPRHYLKGLSKLSSCNIDLHIFVDAGEYAYAASAYFRIETDTETFCTLVGSKAKVAPLRPLSIPRMELMAAVLGARLGDLIKHNHDLKIRKTWYWSDSKTVLWWLRSDPKSYKQFVMFRVGEIQELSTADQWLYIPTKLNIVDMATKMSNQVKCQKSKEWFTGPTFLKQASTQWPKQDILFSLNYNGELRNAKKGTLMASQREACVCLIKFDRFSKYERLLRTMAYVKCFIEKLKFKVLGKTEIRELSQEDLLWSHNYLCHIAQIQTFAGEINLLKGNENVSLSKSSLLYGLSPFLDENSILRIKGRSANAICINYENKNPIILPKSHKFTTLLVDYFHRKYKHIHHDTVINEIFQKYYISGLRKLLKTIRNVCQTCRIHLVTPQPPEMGALPIGRVSPYLPPFTHVGMDFFGPMLTTVGRRTEKRYGVVFTCLTCRAVHLEMAYSLTTSSCNMVIRNFIARRGTPRTIYSDNGTNLKSAEKELRETLAKTDFGKLSAEFTTNDMSWKFNPPASPHMGGSWERLVRSVKRVMYQIIKPDTILNDEMLINLLNEVESIINSRPLTYISLETAEQEALTPNHFLLGSSSGKKPPGKFVKTDQLRKSWRHSQFLADRFWSRWVLEVLPTLTRRTKWFNQVKPIEEGDVVIIVDPNSPRYSWPKGIVEKAIRGSDGQTRSAYVRTIHGIYHRPVAKLAVLDVDKPKSA